MNALRTLVMTALLGTAPALALSFGNLNVTPRGPQNLNLDTGATSLPQGGTATDAKSGLKLVAAQMQLQPGKQLTAQGATVTLRHGGTLRASRVTYDLAAGTVTATGEVQYNDARFQNLRADRLTVFLKGGVVTATGDVRASNPVLGTPAVSFDPSTMQALAQAPVNLKQGSLKAAVGSGHLLVTFSGPRVLRATNRVDSATLGRFAPYLK